ncbi:MAG: DNA recombination protein RmuC [Ruminococcus sp.]|nr:DNA recombination protein RmuC [Ruminococcus sp.]
MEIALPLICFIAGLILGILLWNYLTRRNNPTAFYEAQIQTLKAEFEQERNRLQAQTERNEENIRRESIAQFKALAAEILSEQTGGLKQSNAEQINALLRPLSENIENFRKAVNDSYVQESASRKSLTDQIDRLMQINQTIGTDAKNLTSALRGDSKVQGDWGEMILQTMLERAGLQKDIHFLVQATRADDGSTFRNEYGVLQRPDVIIILPDNRRLVIDSKVSLTAFTEYVAAEDAAQRELAAKRNLQSVKKHIDELSEKKYQATVEGSADHVLMFIPNEGAYITALQSDPDLWQYAYDRHVAIVSPTHLFSVMKIISQLWLQDKQNRNTLRIAEKGGDLYDKIVLFIDAWKEVGNNLARATESYEKAANRLSTGKGNIVRLTEQLKELGAKAKKQLPKQLLENQSEDEDI